MLNEQEALRHLAPLIRHAADKKAQAFMKRFDDKRYEDKFGRERPKTNEKYLKRAFSPFNVSSIGASKLKQKNSPDDFVSETESEEIESKNKEDKDISTDEEYLNISPGVNIADDTLQEIATDVQKKHFFRLNKKMEKNLRHHELVGLRDRQKVKIIPHVIRSSKREVEERATRLAIEAEYFWNDSVTEERALRFARSQNVKYLFNKPPYLPLTRGEPQRREETEIRLVIDKCSALLVGVRKTLIDSKKPIEEIVQQLETSVAKILTNIANVKKHFRGG